MTAEEEYAINFSEQQMKSCLSFHCNALHSYLFAKDVEIYKFKAEDREINVAALCFGNVSKKTFQLII